MKIPRMKQKEYQYRKNPQNLDTKKNVVITQM